MIDWFTVAAQIVNFLILVALLKYFLYGRIIEAMERREQSIAERWDEAERRQTDLTQELEAAQTKSRELDLQREEMLAEVRDEVAAYRQELTGKAREEANEAKQRWAESIREETDAFLKHLRTRASEQFLGISQKALADLADADLEDRIVQRFLRRLAELGDDERQTLQTSLAESGNRALIQTAWDHPQELRDRIVAALQQQFGDDLEVRLERSDDLVCGIALHTDAHKLAWDLGDYLRSLEEEIRVVLDEEAASIAPAAEAAAHSADESP